MGRLLAEERRDMRKPTSITHYGGGVASALVLLFISITAGVLMVMLFTILEIWDAAKGRDSWWDLQEFISGFFAVNILILLLALIELIWR